MTNQPPAGKSGKKALPPRKKKASKRGASKPKLSTLNKALAQKDKALMLDPVAVGNRPEYYLFDDDAVFLKTLNDTWRADYAEAFTLHALNTHDVDVAQVVRDRLKSNQRVDAVYLDKNLASGTSSQTIIAALRDIECARFVPIVLITTDPFKDTVQEVKDSPQMDLESSGPDWVLHGKRASPSFVHQLQSTAYLARNLAVDKAWIAVLDKAAQLGGSTNGSNGNTSQTAAFDHAYNSLKDDLSMHLSIDLSYVRRRNLASGAYEHVAGHTPKLEVCDLDQVPFLAAIVNDEAELVRRESLGVADVGVFPSAKGHHVLACYIRYRNDVIGLLTLYRKGQEAPFRDKDEFFVRQLCNVLGTQIGHEEENTRLRNMKTALLRYISEVDKCEEEIDIVKKLGEYLHERINRNSDKAKTTIRLLCSPSGKLVRHFVKGDEPKNKYDPITIDDKGSAYAKVVREAEAGPVLVNNRHEEPDVVYRQTTAGMVSYITVPLRSLGVTLGAANMEQPYASAYREEDKYFADGITDMAARAILRLRSQDFLTDALEIANQVFQQADHSTADQSEHSSTAILCDALSKLYEYTRYSVLLRLEKVGESWDLQTVYWYDEKDSGLHKGGQLADQTEQPLSEWVAHIKANWRDTWLGKKLDPMGKSTPQVPFTCYTGDANQIRSDEKLRIGGEPLIARSQYLLVPNANMAFSLLFRLPDALNDFQQNLLKHFNVFLGEALRGRAWLAAGKGFQLGGMALAQMRHAINNDLNLAAGMLDTLEDKVTQVIPNPNPIAEDIKIIRRAINDVSRSAMQTSYYFRELQRKEINIADLWQSISRERHIVANSASVEVVEQPVTVRGAPTKLHTDQQMLEEVIFDLVQNAVQAIEDSCVNGLGYPQDTKQVWLEVGLPADQQGVYLDVVDNGPGIPESVQHKDRLFELGATTKGRGTGFGLFYGKAIAQKLGGSLTLVESQGPTSLTRFRLHLPEYI